MTVCTCSPSITSGIISGMTDAPHSPAPQTDKVRYNRVWRAAKRQALRLEKSPLRDPYALGFGSYRLRNTDGELVAGQDDRGSDYGLTLDQVEAWLRGERP